MTTIEYRPNSAFEAAPQSNPDVGGQRRHSQPRWVASRISVNPGAHFAQPTIVRDFEYYEPIYDVADRAFRGFRSVLELGPLVGAVRSATRTTFHTSDALRGNAREIVISSVTVNPQDPENRSLWAWAMLRKKLLDYASASGAAPVPTVTFADGTTGTLASIGDMLTVEAFTAFGALMGGSPAAAEAFLAFPVRETEEVYEGLPAPLVAQTRRSFDVYGNVRELARLGDPGTSVDDATATLQYVTADSTGGAGFLLANRPWRVQVTGSGSGVPFGTTLTRSLEVFYDGNSGDPAGQYLVRGNPTTVRHAWTNANGQSTYVAIGRTFDVYGNLTRVDAPYDVAAPPSDLAFSMIQYDSVSATFPVVVTVGSTAGAQYDLISIIEYETAGCGSPLGMGLPCRSTDPNQQVETHRYDAFGREIASTGPNGAATATLYYDAARGTINQRTETRTRWSSTGPADPSQDANAISEVRYFDGLGRTLEEQRSGLGGSVARRFTFYDDAGRVGESSRWDFGANPVASTFYGYDTLGRVLAEELADGTLHAYSYAPRQTTTTTSIPVDGIVHKRVAKVDALGRLSEVQEFESPTGSPAITTYTHDAFDQLVQVRDAITNNASLCGSNPACPGQTHVTTAYFDELGNRTRLDDPDSGTWLASYDARGLVGITEDPRHKFQLYAYDPLGRLQTRTAANPDVYEIGDTYTYGLVGTTVPNGLGRVVRIQDQLGEDSFEYDTAGNISFHRRILATRRFDFARVYDPVGRITATTYPDGETATWHFDKRLLTRVSTVNGAYAGDYLANVTYDALERELDVALGNTASSPLVTSTRSYHPVSGRLQRLEGKVGSQRVGLADYGIDGAGRVRTVAGETMGISGILQPFTFDYSYDGLDRLVVAPAGGFAYDHDALGNLVTKDSLASNGFGWASLQYADPVRPHALTHAVSTDATRTLDYSYDAAGNVLQKNRTGYQGAPGQGAAAVTFTYDSQGRLKTVTDGGNVTVLGYAADGRQLLTRRVFGPRVELPEPDFEYHVSLARVNKHFIVGGARVASSARTWSAPSASLPALLTWRGPDGEAPPPWAYAAAYAVLGLLLLGAALRRREAEAATRALALRLSSAGTLLLVAPALMASPCGVGPPPATSDLGTHNEPALFYLTDHLGSTILTVEDGGSVRNRYVYMPFGDPGLYNEGPSLRHRFTGEEVLEGTGLYVLGARVYDPETGRFLQPDPLVANPADPQSFNRYTYALNNPLRWIDPSGLWPEEGPTGGGGGSSVPSADVYPRDNPFPTIPKDFFETWDGGHRADRSSWQDDLFDFLPGNSFSGLEALAAGPREGSAAPGGAVSQGRPTSIEQVESQGVQLAALNGPVEAVVGPFFPLGIPGAGAETAIRVFRPLYVRMVESLTTKVPAMREAGMGAEQIARVLHAERRLLAEQFKKYTPPAKLEEIYARNVRMFGDKLGPSIDWLRAQGRSWEEIIESASRSGGRDLGF